MINMVHANQKIIPLYEDDPKAVRARSVLRVQKCIHCGKEFQINLALKYTQLSNNKIIWWCADHVINDYGQE